jgi:2-octaprenyl-6-methoxyphenol hydroxylase
MPEASSSPKFDVVVIGAGLAGLAAALGFSRAGFRVASVGRLERSGPGRTVALLGRSLDFLDDLGLLAQVEALGAPMRTLRLVDDTGSLLAARPVEFHASELDRDVLGYNVENAALAERVAAALGNLPRYEEDVVAFDFGADAARLTLAGGHELSARLVVGADGRGSPSRKAAGIDMSVRAFGQTALTLFLRHSRPHDDASTEFHTREGPFTLVPLPPAPGVPHRSSLVWLMRDASAERVRALSDADLAEEIRRRAHFMLGDMQIDGGRGLFPMTVQRVSALTGRRLALTGDAAHAFPPIGAQGLNLGLRDVAGILAAATRARDEGGDIGGEKTLAAYAAARRPDIATRTLGVGLLNTALLTPWLPMDAARGIGLSALAGLSPLRRMAMREGLNPFLAR